MTLRERDEAIWQRRCEGATYSRIAGEFDISKERVRKICQKKKKRIEHANKGPFLKRELPARLKNSLIKLFGSEEIFEDPETNRKHPRSRRL